MLAPSVFSWKVKPSPHSFKSFRNLFNFIIVCKGHTKYCLPSSKKNNKKFVKYFYLKIIPDCPVSTHDSTYLPVTSYGTPFTQPIWDN